MFINRRRTIVKFLGFEHGGFFIWAKSLEQGLFASPPVLASGRKPIPRQKLMLASAGQRASLPNLAPILSGVVDWDEIAR